MGEVIQKLLGHKTAGDQVILAQQIDKFEQFCLKPAETDVYAMIDDLEIKLQQIIDDNAW